MFTIHIKHYGSPIKNNQLIALREIITAYSDTHMEHKQILTHSEGTMQSCEVTAKYHAQHNIVLTFYPTSWVPGYCSRYRDWLNDRGIGVRV
jgi:hypothetical protein